MHDCVGRLHMLLTIFFLQARMTWHKQGDFNKVVNYKGSTLIRNCEFYCKTAKTVKEISVCGYNDDSIMIVAKFVVRKEVEHFCLQHADLPIKTEAALFNVYFKPKTSKDSYLFLTALLAVEASIREILVDICTMLKISPTLGLTLDDLKLLDFESAFDAVKNAQDNNCFSLIYAYLEYLWKESLTKPISMDNIYRLASAVSTNNPNFKFAQDYCLEILLRKPHKTESKTLDDDETPSEDFDTLALKFRHAVAGSDQTITDMLFNQLCGNDFGSKSEIRNVHPDVTTLVNLARVLKIKNNK